MTDVVPILLAVMLGAPAGGAALCLAVRDARRADRVSLAVAVLTASAAGASAVIGALDGRPATHGGWYVLDGAGSVMLAVTALVGLTSAVLSPWYLGRAGRGWFPAHRSRASYHAAFHLFWAALLAIPIVGNLGIAWLLVEATTATSALLVGFSGSSSALEAGWKYVVLTTLGLSVALLGIVLLYAGAGDGPAGLHRLDWDVMAEGASAGDRQVSIVAVVLIVVGFASKAGWAPVHNWLPDAHSEAPPPVSALLSAALLPTVVLVVWRVRTALAGGVDAGAARTLLIGFGLASLAVAVPFLWRAAPWKRLLAYSSLEHMGVLALGVAVGGTAAKAGVLLHIAGHGVAKALGFYAAIPLVRADPASATEHASGVLATSRRTGLAMAVSLVVLSGMPPSPLFVSELVILLALIDAGLLPIAAIAAMLLALGFLGLVQALLQALLGEPRGAGTRPAVP